MRKPTFLIDTREQEPYLFPGELSTRTALKTGDYSLLGCENEVAVERKSMSDFIGTFFEAVIDGNDRFFRELERAKDMQFAIIVESGIEMISKIKPHNNHAKIHGNNLLGWMCALTQDFGIPVIPCGSWYGGQLYTKRFLMRYWKQKEEERLNNDSKSPRNKERKHPVVWIVDTEGNHREHKGGEKKPKWNEVAGGKD